MSNPIPPFVCSTPPPIDCIADAPPPLVEDDFGDFAAVDDQFEASSLPVTPVHVTKLPDDTISTEIKFSTSPPPSSGYDFPFVDKKDGANDGNIKTIPDDNSSLSFYPTASSKVDVKNELPYIIEANSPPPFDYQVEDDDLTPCDELENNDEADEFPVDDELAKYDDNISLPSLKFDSLSNHSKSTTPVSEELTKSKHEEFQSVPGGFDAKVSPHTTSDTIPEIPSSTEISVTESEEEPTVPVEIINVREELEKCEAIATRQTSEEQEDGFAEFESFPTICPSNVLERISDEVVTASGDFQTTELQANTEALFEADFSQFSSITPDADAPPLGVSQIIENSQLTEKSALDDLEADDFDDFQDFAVPPKAIEQRKTSVISASSELPEEHSETTKNSDGEDDDFGEFSEVIEFDETTSIPSSNSGFNLTNLNDKLKPILEMMFPVTTDNKELEDTSVVNNLEQLTAISQIDTAKALEHQWINSEVRHSLIKSLGVDSRNILYGEKWNSSMPRYAANLSFNPLEPTKSDKAYNSASSATIDYRKHSDSLTSASATSKTDVPAVEFDWNTSGLVNPLDGVKEILHERTIEAIHTTQPGEPHASVDQQSGPVLTSNFNNSNNNNNNIYDTDKPLRCYGDDEASISTPIEFKSNEDASASVSTAATTATIITTPTTLSGDNIDITCGDFLPSVLETNLDTITATSQALNHNTTHAAKYQERPKTDLETESQHSGVMTTSTYAGPLKETHIYTPSKVESVLSRSPSVKTPRTSESKCPIDFDYEIAAAGIIIDETVVKKEYRDVEYNPGFGSKYREETIEYNHRSSPEVIPPKHGYPNSDSSNRLEKPLQFEKTIDLSEKLPDKKKEFVQNSSSSFDDEFSEFQSVPAPELALAKPTIVPSAVIPSSNIANTKTSPSHWRVLKETADISSTASRTGTPVSLNDEMILCPAILLPQAIQMENKPSIEWPEPGINPEELARIEELFPQPQGGSTKPSPSHSVRSQQQQRGSNRATPQLGADDDDWSDFVSVPAAASNQIQSISQQFQKRQASPAKSAVDPNYDEEWSDFVSSAPLPPPLNNIRPSMYPQFNSASWQNANFYNNPMSAYASPPTSFYYQPPIAQQNVSNNIVPNLSTVNNNTTNTNTNIINNNSINQYLINNQANHLNPHHQQHIQMMRDFSNASPMDRGSLSTTTPSMHLQYNMQSTPGYGYNRMGHQPNAKSNQFGGGASKVAPSISLIPDLGFVAPAPTSFITVPKNSFVAKK